MRTKGAETVRETIAGKGIRTLPQGILAGTILLCLLLAACARSPSVLDPAGPAAARIALLSWIVFVLGGAVYLAVMILLFIALFRQRRRDAEAQREASDGRNMVIFGGIVFPAVILVIVYGLTLGTMAALRTPETADELVIEVIGHQFWWEVRYHNQHFTTANELHIPVGQAVTIKLSSEDVIHSFWVPELHGKLDLVPGDVNSFWLQADEAGEYWGACAEFCGIQHAKMQLVVVAEPEAEFLTWIEQQQQPAPEPVDPLVQQGQQIFFGSGCVYCHTIEGTNASGDLGPDLTHLASRRTLAAGALNNNRGQLAGWITDPQHVKPGNLMPPTALSGAELQALLAYLETLE